MEAVDHVDLVVTDLERSVAFYSELLRPLGYVEVGDIVGERGERVVYIERPTHGGSIGLRERQADSHYDRYAVGIHHLAFAAPTRAVVDERATWLRDNGWTIESGPKEHDYSPAYYALFFFDPDGIKLELVHRPEERELAARIAQLEERLNRLQAQ